MVMPGNNSSRILHYWAGKYPGKVGWLISPPASKCKLSKWLPFALDNGAFGCWKNGVPFDAPAWRQLLQWVRLHRREPLWALVPDAVGDRLGTLRNWQIYSPEVAALGWHLAFAVQDGMTPADVPDSARVIFVGGTTEWKWRTLELWAKSFPHVHVGRVNSFHRLLKCEKLGIDSVDGTGWFRSSEDGPRARDLERWLEGVRQEEPPMLKGLELITSNNEPSVARPNELELL